MPKTLPKEGQPSRLGNLVKGTSSRGRWSGHGFYLPNGGSDLPTNEVHPADQVDPALNLRQFVQTLPQSLAVGADPSLNLGRPFNQPLLLVQFLQLQLELIATEVQLRHPTVQNLPAVHALHVEGRNLHFFGVQPLQLGFHSPLFVPHITAARTDVGQQVRDGPVRALQRRNDATTQSHTSPFNRSTFMPPSSHIETPEPTPEVAVFPSQNPFKNLSVAPAQIYVASP